MGANIPLPALDIKTPQQPDMLGQYGKLVALQNAQQQHQMGGIQLQQAQQGLKDQQGIADWYKTIDPKDPNAFDPAAIGKKLADSGVSGVGILNVQGKMLEQRKNFAAMNKEELANREEVSNNIHSGLNGVIGETDPNKRAQSLTPLINTAAQNKIIPPETAQQLLANPGALTDDQVKSFQRGLGVSAAFARSVAQQQQADTGAQHLKLQQPILEAEALQKQLQVSAKPLADAFASGGIDAYRAALGDLKYNVASQFPATPKSADEIMQGGMTPHEQATLKSNTNVDAAWIAQFTKENGRPPSTGELSVYNQSKRPVNNIMTATDAKDIADAIQNGDQPPTLSGLYRNAGPVRAELARRGVPLAKMEMDWKATQKYISTLNGPQQVRMQQAITTASDSLDKIEGLYKEWQQIAPTSGFKILNKASLTAMKNLPGRPGTVATQLDAQINDLASEIGNVYMGGNSPTDQALKMGQSNLKAEWNDQTFQEGLKQTKLNLAIRKNSMTHGMPAGLSGTINYAPQQAPTTDSPTISFIRQALSKSH